MSDSALIEYCSPTLAGLKTGSLFTVACGDKDILLKEIAQMNRQYACRGLRVIPLGYTRSRALIYIYRPSLLKKDFGDALAARILDERGYATGNADKCVAQLVARLRAAGEFPHEIGLFLGYPPEDVEGFIAHRDDGCKYVGTWRVYGDEVSARKKFADYRMCTISYERQFSRGKKLLDLIVAT